MAQKGPGGKSVGRVTIRVIPDSTQFNEDLKKSLERIEKATHFEVNVDRANVDTTRIKQSIQAQLNTIRGLEIDSEVKAIVNQVQVMRLGIRRELQRVFDEMGIRIRVGVDLRLARHDVELFVDDVNRKQGTVNVNAATAAATLQLRWLTRTRFVDIVPRVNEAALNKVLAQFAALSGARVTLDWLDDFITYISDLDRKLPKLALVTQSITALIALIFSLTSGLVGIGAGLASIVPLFLTVPGFILGTAFAITTFAVAMFDAKKQLEPLTGQMRELADVIQNTFWDAARQPIIDLMTSLRGPLLQSFEAVSGALGRFTGALANAFKQELAGGRLQALFQSMADSIDVLSTGADAFAGALVSLSEIAAQYAVRLAQWFVDLSIRFDNWLIQISNDGRLEAWIERGITSLYALADILGSVGRQFAALWEAAERAGGGGIEGFAENMRKIADVMNGAQFQATLTALFRGANTAMRFIGDGLVAVGDAFTYLQGPLENLLATSGKIFGELLTNIAQALSNPRVRDSLNRLIDSLYVAFATFGQFLPQIFEGFAAIADVAGPLSIVLGEVLGEAFAALTPILAEISAALMPIIPILGDALVSAINILGPLLLGVAEVILPILIPILEVLATVLKFLAEEVFPRVAEFWETHIVQPFQEFINEHGPKLEKVWSETIAPTIDWFVTYVLPPLLDIIEELWNFISEELMKALENLAAWFEDPNNKKYIILFTGIIAAFLVQLFIVPIAISAIIAALLWLINVISAAITAWNDFWDATKQKTVARPGQYSANRFGIPAPAKQAKGGITTRPGLSWVGEEGPELLSLPKGARVLPLDRIPLKDGMGGNGNTLNYYAAPNTSFDAEDELFKAMRKSKVVAGW